LITEQVGQAYHPPASFFGESKKSKNYEKTAGDYPTVRARGYPQKWAERQLEKTISQNHRFFFFFLLFSSFFSFFV